MPGSESRSHRALIEFSIRLRHQEDFRRRIAELREKWLDDFEGDWPGVDQLGPGFPLPPRVRELPVPKRGLKALEFQADLGRLIQEFVPLKTFPPLVPSFTDIENPHAVALQHPLSRFLAYCILYDIDGLPADAGISAPGFVTVLPVDRYETLQKGAVYPGWLIVAFLPGSTKSEVTALVDEALGLEALHRREGWYTEPAPRRGLIDVRRAYETWRLRYGGLRPTEVAQMLVEMGLDESPSALSTLNERYSTARESWDLPERPWQPDE